MVANLTYPINLTTYELKVRLRVENRLGYKSVFNLYNVDSLILIQYIDICYWIYTKIIYIIVKVNTIKSANVKSPYLSSSYTTHWHSGRALN